jgi:hypothetical protein
MQLTFHCICICPEVAFVLLACNWVGVRALVLDTDVALTGVPPKKGGVGRKASFALLMHNYGN